MTDIPNPGRAMYLYSAIGIAAAAAYYAFFWFNTHLLPDRTGTAIVTAKHHMEGKVENRYQPGPDQFIPTYQGDAWLLYLELDGKATGLGVAKEFYDGVAEGDRVEVVYRKPRFTGRPAVTRVVSVVGKAGG
jgi:hypothetical protein